MKYEAKLNVVIEANDFKNAAAAAEAAKNFLDKRKDEAIDYEHDSSYGTPKCDSVTLEQIREKKEGKK